MQKSLKVLLPKLLTRLFIRIKATNIKSSSCHFPGMHLHLFHHIMRKITWGILATTIINGMSYFIQILLQVDIEWWHSPMALWLLRLLLHIQYLVVIIQNNHTCALQFLDARLLIVCNPQQRSISILESRITQSSLYSLQFPGVENKISCASLQYSVPL